MPLFPDTLSLIGGTPLVRTSRLTYPGVDLHLKLEFLNPGGSIKDRIGKHMIECAEREGRLRRGMTLVEATAGNTGLGLAVVAAAKGYPLLVVIPDKMSAQKIEILRAMGATVRITRTAVPPDHPDYYSNLARSIAEEDPDRYFHVDQFRNPHNPEAHYLTTAPEIWADLQGNLDAFVAGVGTGGTLSGCGRYFRERKPEAKIVLADPVGSVLAGYIRTGKIGEAGSYLVEGIGEDYVPEVFEPGLVTHAYSISDAESFQASLELLRKEGLCVGTSSGTILAGAARFIREMGFRGSLVAVMPDTGRNYAMKLFDREFLEKHSLLPPAAE